MSTLWKDFRLRSLNLSIVTFLLFFGTKVTGHPTPSSGRLTGDQICNATAELLSTTSSHMTFHGVLIPLSVDPSNSQIDEVLSSSTEPLVYCLMGASYASREELDTFKEENESRFNIGKTKTGIVQTAEEARRACLVGCLRILFTIMVEPSDSPVYVLVVTKRESSMDGNHAVSRHCSKQGDEDDEEEDQEEDQEHSLFVIEDAANIVTIPPQESFNQSDTSIPKRRTKACIPFEIFNPNRWNTKAFNGNSKGRSEENLTNISPQQWRRKPRRRHKGKSPHCKHHRYQQKHQHQRYQQQQQHKQQKQHQQHQQYQHHQQHKQHQGNPLIKKGKSTPGNSNLCQKIYNALLIRKTLVSEGNGTVPRFYKERVKHVHVPVKVRRSASSLASVQCFLNRFANPPECLGHSSAPVIEVDVQKELFSCPFGCSSMLFRYRNKVVDFFFPLNQTPDMFESCYVPDGQKRAPTSTAMRLPIPSIMEVSHPNNDRQAIIRKAFRQLTSSTGISSTMQTHIIKTKVVKQKGKKYKVIIYFDEEFLEQF